MNAHLSTQQTPTFTQEQMNEHLHQQHKSNASSECCTLAPERLGRDDHTLLLSRYHHHYMHCLSHWYWCNTDQGWPHTQCHRLKHENKKKYVWPQTHNLYVRERVQSQTLVAVVRLKWDRTYFSPTKWNRSPTNGKTLVWLLSGNLKLLGSIFFYFSINLFF